MAGGVSISKQGSLSELNPQVVPAGKIWRTTDTNEYAIGDGVTTFQNLIKYTYEELKKLAGKEHPLYNIIDPLIDYADVEIDGGSLD